jgi:virginiamycin A acetyltransferase
MLTKDDDRHSTIAKTVKLSSKVTLDHPIILRDLVEVWPETHIGAFTFVNVASVIYGKVRIGRFCSIGRAVEVGAPSHPLSFLSTHGFQYDKDEYQGYPDYGRLQTAKWEMFADTRIGHDVWIGSKVVIKAGVTIGDGAVVGAGSIVTSDVPPYAIAVGSPARIARYRFSEAIIGSLLELRWWDLPISELVDLPFQDVHACVRQLQHRRSRQGERSSPPAARAEPARLSR